MEHQVTETSTAPTTTLSPALAAMAAQLIIPHQYSKFVEVTVESLNSQCPSRIRYIGK